MNIYLASSWKNPFYRQTLEMLRGLGHCVYDFRASSFAWENLDPRYQSWGATRFRDALRSDDASAQYVADLRHMRWAHLFVGVAPFGRSASMEMGWAAGQCKPTILYFPIDNNEMGPELMVKLFSRIVCGPDELAAAIKEFQP